MAEPHAVSAPVAKRAEVRRAIHTAARRLAQLRADLIHVDAVLRLYERPEEGADEGGEMTGSVSALPLPHPPRERGLALPGTLAYLPGRSPPTPAAP